MLDEVYDAIKVRVAACKRRLRVAEREISWLEELRDTQAAIEPGRRHLSILANPLESLRVILQATPWYVSKRASELGVLLVHYSKPGSAHIANTSLPIVECGTWVVCRYPHDGSFPLSVTTIDTK